MKQFARMYADIDETTKTNEKVSAMVRYFSEADPEDSAWAVNFLVGRRPKRLMNSTKLQTWAADIAGIPPWLFFECYESVGDLGETIALVLPTDATEADSEDLSLASWVVNRILPLVGMDELEQRALLASSWAKLDQSERFVYNKLITGAFRVGVSQELVVRALSQLSSVPVPAISHRLMGDWSPTGAFFESLISDEGMDTEVSRPYPFCLAYPLEQDISALGDISEWQAEWKWDGIRSQLIRREGRSFVWSRGEELITERFPEIAEVCDFLPDGTVIDGELLAWSGGKPLKFMELQKRIGRKVLSKKILHDVPVSVVAFDLLELGGIDIRQRPLAERRFMLEGVIKNLPTASLVDGERRILLSRSLHASSWDELAKTRETARDLNVEGLMLKRLDSPYLVGRKKGSWWKWKVDALTVDAVLVYAQRGHGKRASLYTDYTFALWKDGSLVPFAKAYSGLTDEEIRRVDAIVRRSTVEKFGPVRTVKPELVMELAFEGIQLSNRHKSGIAVRFPRISRWRHDKRIEDADSIETVRAMLENENRPLV